MSTLSCSIAGINFENPFLLASAPPAASLASIEKAFQLGWGGVVIKTVASEQLGVRFARIFALSKPSPCDNCSIAW